MTKDFFLGMIAGLTLGLIIAYIAVWDIFRKSSRSWREEAEG